MEGLASDVWAAHEFGEAPLGDKRLTARLVNSAHLLAGYPGTSMSDIMEADWAATKEYHRLLDQDEASEVTCENILATHRKCTAQRMPDGETALFVVDGSTLNYACHPRGKGLTIIGRNQASTRTKGMDLHVTLAMNAAGLPLGVVRTAYPDPDAKPTHPPRMQRWIDGMRDVAALRQASGKHTRAICVMDREADAFALYDEARRLEGVEVVVRARHDRCLANGQKLFEVLSSGEADRQVSIEIPRLSVRPKDDETSGAAGRSYRCARAVVRFRRFMLPATQGSPRPPVCMYGVHVRELDPPEGESAVEWYVLTSLPINHADEALNVLGHYVRRWGVEEFFRVLKTGLKIEKLSMRTALRLQRAITIHCVLAWRIMVYTRLGQDVPGLDPSLMHTPLELRFLTEYAEDFKLSPPKTLGDATLLVATLGGYLNRNHDGPPGYPIMWIGDARLRMAMVGYRTAERWQPDSIQIQRAQARFKAMAERRRP